MTIRLFLLGSLLVLLGLGTLLALANKTCVGASDTESAVGVLGAWVVADLAVLDSDFVGDGESLVGELDLAVVELVADLLGSIDLVLRGVTLLRRLDLAGEEDEALLVLLEAQDVGLERLLGQVLAAGVDSNTDGGRQLAWDTSFLQPVSNCVLLLSMSHLSYLQLSERETTTGANAAVVLEGRAAHHRPQTVDWAWCELGGLLVAGIASALLATGLQQKSRQERCSIIFARPAPLLSSRGE